MSLLTSAAPKAGFLAIVRLPEFDEVCDKVCDKVHGENRAMRSGLTGCWLSLGCKGMPKSSGQKKGRRKAMLLGVGLDSDGHKRVTTGPNFALVGGSEETHEIMTEKAIRINEKLAAKGKSLDEVSREEFDDVAQSVGLHRDAPEQN